MSNTFFTKQVIDFSKVGIDSSYFESGSNEDLDSFGRATPLLRHSISNQQLSERVLLQLQVGLNYRMFFLF